MLQLTRNSSPKCHIQRLVSMFVSLISTSLGDAIRTVVTPIFFNIFSSCSFLTCRIFRIKAYSHAYSFILFRKKVRNQEAWSTEVHTHLLMLLSSSLISLVRLSLFFICVSCIFFKNRAMLVFNGMEKIIMPTPTKAGHPSRLYRDTKAKVIYSSIASATDT